MTSPTRPQALTDRASTVLKSATQNQGFVERLLDTAAELIEYAELLAVSDLVPRKPPSAPEGYEWRRADALRFILYVNGLATGTVCYEREDSWVARRLDGPAFVADKPTKEEAQAALIEAVARPLAPQQQPVAWRVKDFADGWILCHSEEESAGLIRYGGRTLREPLYTHPAPQEQQETQATVTKWCEDTFGAASSNARVAARANEELAELLKDLTRNDADGHAIEEAADVVIILYRLAARMGRDLLGEVDRKMAINRQRKWNVGPDGHGYHVKDASPPPTPPTLSENQGKNTETGMHTAENIATRLVVCVTGDAPGDHEALIEAVAEAIQSERASASRQVREALERTANVAWNNEPDGVISEKIKALIPTLAKAET